MSLKTIAHQLEGKGRNGDTTLMHIQPTELAVLEAMLGKTTRNPKTGLPEAFSWKKLLAGIALGVAAIPTGGASLLGALGMAGGLGAGAAGALGTLGGAIGAGLIGDSLKSKPKSTASAAGKYLDERTAERVKNQYMFAPPTTPRYSINDQLQYDSEGNVLPQIDPLGRQKNWYSTGYAKGGLTEAKAKETVLAYLARMQPQQQPQGMAHGRMVKGGGTGLSVSIPARIGTQPVALADGEYVIPADVVSMMGDGSTDAGGRTLDQIVAKVRMQKTGTKKQAGPLRPSALKGRR
mgnify:CR=1 FL=1